MRWIKDFLHASVRLFRFLFGQTIGRLCYKGRYLKGRHFESMEGTGWRWVASGALFQKGCGFNRTVPWPVSPRIQVFEWENIEFDNDDLNNFQTFGTYFQAIGAKIVIGKGTLIAPNVGLITANHDPSDLDGHVLGKDIVLGQKCWIGMNSVILPGVTLGDHTMVGAGSVVTKSFPEGSCILAGNPAAIIKRLPKS